MNNQNKTAREIYKETFQELQSLANRHLQITKIKPFSIELPMIAAEMRRVAALVQLWKSISDYNTSRSRS
jgi:hypothetical protein